MGVRNRKLGEDVEVSVVVGQLRRDVTVARPGRRREEVKIFGSTKINRMDLLGSIGGIKLQSTNGLD